MIRVDQGHAWRPPFGIDRVGSPPIVHVKLSAARTQDCSYHVVAYRNRREIERHIVKLALDQSTYRGTAPLTSIPEDVALLSECAGDRSPDELVRRRISWPKLEADAQARPAHPTNPVDLGTILVPQDWLLLAGGQAAQIAFSAISHTHPIPDARLKVWFDGEKAVEADFPLAANRRAEKTIELPLRSTGTSSVLHIELTDGSHGLWKKGIRTMIVARPPRWPRFGAVATKLRYDAPIAVSDLTSGATSAMDYDTAWDRELRDVVVFLPNGSRFVFWRGASYAPFWAGTNNTGLGYQWLEQSITPPGVKSVDAPEPLQDKELRYSHVRIMESSPSRVHVRWNYQIIDINYQRWGTEVTEDFYFYPDGFGTRVVTLTTVPGTDYTLSELMVLLPQSAYPFEILPNPRVDLLFLDGEKRSIDYPLSKGSYQALSLNPPSGSEVDQAVERIIRTFWKRMVEDGRASPDSAPADPAPGLLGKISHSQPAQMVYRVRSHKDDPATAIYFSPSNSSSVIPFLPVYDRGELVSPSHWGDNWPLSRGNPTRMGVINDAHRQSSPNHIALIELTEPEPICVAVFNAVDALGRSQSMRTERRVWLIAKTDSADDVLLDWARSFASPPSLEVKGARIDFPSYSPERRAIRLALESNALEIRLKPTVRTINPVFELQRVAGHLGRLIDVTRDGKSLSPDSYTWDGTTLWVKAYIDSRGSVIGVQFH